MKDYLLMILSILGFTNAFYIYWSFRRYKKTGKKMYCFIGGDCGKVIGSKHGETFGVKHELSGMVYYFEMFLYAIMRLVTPQYTGGNLRENMIMLAVVASLFSLYSLYVQAMKLKKFCSWSLVAIGVNIVLLIVVL